jgi:hypothetical protein
LTPGWNSKFIPSPVIRVFLVWKKSGRNFLPRQPPLSLHSIREPSNRFCVRLAVIDFVRRAKARNPNLLYLCDPVMGDADLGFYAAMGAARPRQDSQSAFQYLASCCWLTLLHETARIWR